MFRWLRAITAAADTRDQVLQLLPQPVAGDETALDVPDDIEAPRADLVQEVEALRAEVANLRARVVALSGGADEDDLLHDHLSQLYQNLVSQQLRQLARLRWARVRGARPAAEGPMAQARIVRELVRLTVAGGADEDDISAWLRGDGRDDLTDPERRAVEGACGQARRLKAGMAAAAKPAVFVENVPRGEPLAAGAGQPWAGCSPDGAAAFVVAPAYMLRGRVLTEPMVFTRA